MGYDLRRFDIYRKVPKDLTQPTTTGAVISISSGIFILFLLISELLSFMQNELISELYVDDPTTGYVSIISITFWWYLRDRIPVNIRLELSGMECKFLGVDIQDEHGRHEVGCMENTRKDPMNNGQGNYHIFIIFVFSKTCSISLILTI